MQKSALLLTEHIKNKIKELAELHSGPFYIYDTATILQTCRDLLDIPYTPKSIHFAMMANSHPQFLQIVKNAHLNIFVNSIGHLDLALEQGYSGNEIIFAASAMNEATMRKVESCGAMVVLDSVSQVAQWQRMFPCASFSIRCNIGELVVPKKTIGGYFIGSESRLGLNLAEIEQMAQNRNVVGLHVYVGTNIIEIDYFIECYRRIVELAGLFPALESLDFGGGFGLGEGTAPFDISAYGSRVADLMEQLSRRLGRHIKLVLEPGRIVGGTAGYFVCTAVDVKERGNQQLVGVNASSAQFPRPLFYPDSAFHPVSILSRSPNGSERTSSIYGCSTYSRDYLARNILLPEVSIGDTVVLGHAGSYCAAAFTNFLGFPQASEFFL